ncbi:MAG: hypothetical protein EOM12_18230 [Verrucomicrobiae bacterium]|nr:hypothetical protein [Verrucomicrobiae bacterium]
MAKCPKCGIERSSDNSACSICGHKPVSSGRGSFSPPSSSLEPAVRSRAPYVVGLIAVALLAVGLVAFLLIGKNPLNVEVPSSVKNWSDEKLRDAVEQLSDEERELFGSYAARVALATAFGGEGVIPEGKTVGDVIQDQREWQKEQKEQEQRQALLAGKLLKEQADARREMNNAVTVSLVDILFQKSDYSRDIYSDYFAMRVGFENRTSRDIVGIKGVLMFKDIFGDLINGVRLSYDDGVAAHDSVVWSGTMEYNQFDDDDKKLRSTSRDKLKVEWEPDTYLFSDGSKMTMPRGTY